MSERIMPLLGRAVLRGSPSLQRADLAGAIAAYGLGAWQPGECYRGGRGSARCSAVLGVFYFGTD
jgi:hypothetical protein